MTAARLALTLGDPAGIGPEIILKALADPTIPTDNITIFGSRPVLDRAYQDFHSAGVANPAQLQIRDLPLTAPVAWGQGSAATGAASFAYLQAAIQATLAGEFQGIVTAPIAKSLWQAAGHDYPGQTEVLALQSQSPDYGMLFVARSPHTEWQLITLLATTHIPLQQVPIQLTPALMSQKLGLLIRTLAERFDRPEPTIAIAGLNPHSGEEGKLGTEEQDWLIPWLAEQRQRYPRVTLLGPVPPDTLWVKPGQAWFQTAQTAGVADAYLALYHDQGLIPVKLMGFEQAINTTIGLPFIRTSPDHGTAFDIAGRGIANAQSMKAAIQLAAQLSS
ncbi:MAG: 4-hydroxythreonine-4-phosphate dehydrogenase PdxA [Spirulina sp. SIO3F2]|nr:4-hydroxythreonine-4-phosphate dehydrogenase PdxA [Spirulina sp. SIO3F2]